MAAVLELLLRLEDLLDEAAVVLAVLVRVVRWRLLKRMRTINRSQNAICNSVYRRQQVQVISLACICAILVRYLSPWQ